MLIKNAKVFMNKKFVETDILFDEKIAAVGKIEGQGMDGKDLYVLPGLVDIHTHGALGEDFSDGEPTGLDKLEQYYAAHGVTSYLATTMTLKEKTLLPVMAAIGSHNRKGGAKCAGIHLEGPFLSNKRRGAQNPDNLHAADIGLLKRLNDASNDMVKLVTVACEEPGAMEFIEKAAKDMCVSLGHTAADYDTAMEAFKRGASHVTHTFNCMEPLLHRAPGVIGAALDMGASAELICDGLHIHPSVMRMAHKAFGDKLNLVSDSIRSAYMPDGEYTLGGQEIVVNGSKATLKDGTLAGSSIALIDGVRNCVKFGIPLEAAVYAATEAPARAVNISAGVIKPGAAADIMVLDENLNLLQVYIDGKLAWQKN